MSTDPWGSPSLAQAQTHQGPTSSNSYQAGPIVYVSWPMICPDRAVIGWYVPYGRLTCRITTTQQKDKKKRRNRLKLNSFNKYFSWPLQPHAYFHHAKRHLKSGTDETGETSQLSLSLFTFQVGMETVPIVRNTQFFFSVKRKLGRNTHDTHNVM